MCCFSWARPAPVLAETYRASACVCWSALSKSALFTTTSACAALAVCSISVASSNTWITQSALSMACCARAMPSFSTASACARMPAVSNSLNATPSILISMATTSRVVPGMSVTIARFWAHRALNKDDLPTLGLPVSTKVAPCCSLAPCLASAVMACN